jgi:hypothetical protein
LCRKLVAAGHDPATVMHVYRGQTLALKVRAIGEAANCGSTPRALASVSIHPCQRGR